MIVLAGFPGIYTAPADTSPPPCLSRQGAELPGWVCDQLNGGYRPTWAEIQAHNQTAGVLAATLAVVVMGGLVAAYWVGAWDWTRVRKWWRSLR